jgi:hypothetical protein|tara:strand:- start:1175 stop:1645 length:471 start_codon:yes stop_codon:yes gene_type:complete
MALSMTQGPDGLSFETQVVNVTCNEALAKGEVVTFLLTNGGFSTCEKSDASDPPNTNATLHGIALEAVTAGSSGQIGVRGVFDAVCEAAADAGVACMVSQTTDGRLDIAPTGDPMDAPDQIIKIVGHVLENTATAGDLTSVLFDGINGFGSTIPAS